MFFPEDDIKNRRRHSTGSADFKVQVSDLIDFQSDASPKSHDLFGAAPLMKAALGKSSRYKQLVDTDEEQEIFIPEPTKSEPRKSESQSGIWKKLMEPNSNDKDIQPYSKKSDSKADSGKWTKLVDTDEEKESSSIAGSLPDHPHWVRKTPEVVESSSDYHEEDNSQSFRERPSRDFSYQELDDEYGSRPSKPYRFGGQQKGKDKIQVQPSPDYSCLPQQQNPAEPSSQQQSQHQQQDRIVGHNYGVKPLLDDDELVGAEEDQETLDGMSTPSQASGVTSPSTAGTSPVTSPTFDQGQQDVFAAAPFLKRPRKKPKSSTVAAQPADGSGDVFTKAPFKAKTPVKPKSPPSVPGSRSNSLYSEGQVTGGVNVNEDPFGKAPFISKGSKGSSASTPTSSAVSPVSDKTVSYRPPSLSPQADVGIKQSSSMISVQSQTATFKISPDQRPLPPVPKPSASKQPEPQPKTDGKPDMFGSVPFTSMSSYSSGEHSVLKSEVPTSTSNYITYNPSSSERRLFHGPKKGFGHKRLEEEGNRKNGTDEETELLTSTTSPKHQRPEDLLLPTFGQPNSGPVQASPAPTKHSKSKQRTKRNSYGISNVAFSNMSFNDDEILDDESPTRIELPETDAHKQTQMSSRTTPSGKSSTRAQSYVKTVPSAQGSTVDMYVNTMAQQYDTATWPRKGRKGVSPEQVQFLQKQT